MSSFKHKPSKLKYRSDVTTLHELHRNYLSDFDNNKQTIPQKRRKILDLNNDLATKNLDLTERSKILSTIKNLEYEISRIDGDSEYLDYISKAGDLLVNYYNITSGIYYNSGDNECDQNQSNHNTTDSYFIEDENKNNDSNNANDNTEQNSPTTEITYISETTIQITQQKQQNTTAIDKLQRLNDISKLGRKIKKEVKKRRIIQPTSTSKSILQFLPPTPSQTQAIQSAQPAQSTQPTQENVPANCLTKESTESLMILNRATLQHKYLMLVDKAYACGKVKAEKIIYCPDCKETKGTNVEKISFPSEGCYVCKDCGHTEHIIMESELPSHKELANEKQKYPYKKINHLKEKLNQFQSKESADVPEDVCAIVRYDLRKKGIDVRQSTPPIIRTILKKHKLTDWYEHLQQIYCKVSGSKPITLSTEVEETIINMFHIMQEPFHRHCPKHRSNFLSYSYVLNKLFRILKMPEHAIFFGLLKSKEKLREQDVIWSKICKDLDWKFYSSF